MQDDLDFRVEAPDGYMEPACPESVCRIGIQMTDPDLTEALKNLTSTSRDLYWELYSQFPTKAFPAWREALLAAEALLFRVREKK